MWGGRHIHITLQSSLYWSATDAPAINPAQALSHFCSLMRKNMEQKRKERNTQEKCRSQECVFSWKQPTKSYTSGQMHLFSLKLPHLMLNVIFNPSTSRTVVPISRRMSHVTPQRGRVVQVRGEWKGSLNDWSILTPPFSCEPLY